MQLYNSSKTKKLHVFQPLNTMRLIVVEYSQHTWVLLLETEANWNHLFRTQIDPKRVHILQPLERPDLCKINQLDPIGLVMLFVLLHFKRRGNPSEFPSWHFTARDVGVLVSLVITLLSYVYIYIYIFLGPRGLSKCRL